MADVAAPVPDNDPDAMAATPAPVGAAINGDGSPASITPPEPAPAEAPAPAAQAHEPATIPEPSPPQIPAPMHGGPMEGATTGAATTETATTETAAMETAAMDSQPSESAPMPREPWASTAPPAFTTPTPSIPSAAAPSIATTIDVPAATGAGPVPAADGGEFELLLQKLNQWISSGALQEQWQAVRTPLSLLAGLIALLLVVRVYGALLAVIESLPLLPGLLELVGVITLTRFGLHRLVRTEDRQQVIQGLRDRWQAFLGRR